MKTRGLAGQACSSVAALAGTWEFVLKLSGLQQCAETCCFAGAGMELYPRIGTDLDIKTWTNCRMGMMGWAVLILAYALRQYQAYGSISDSMLVSVTLMELYIFKFFL